MRHHDPRHRLDERLEQLVGLIRIDDDVLLEIGFHVEYPKAATNDEVLSRLEDHIAPEEVLVGGRRHRRHVGDHDTFDPVFETVHPADLRIDLADADPETLGRVVLARRLGFVASTEQFIYLVLNRLNNFTTLASVYIRGQQDSLDRERLPAQFWNSRTDSQRQVPAAGLDGVDARLSIWLCHSAV